MAIVYSGELSGGSISSMVSLLQKDVEDCNKLKASINSFISGSVSTLKGAGYDAARAKAESYLAILDSRASVASQLASAISAACGSMSSYMEGYSVLDDAKLPEIKAEISSISASIEQLRNSSTTIDGKIVDYSSEIAAYEAQLAELEKYKDKLEKLAGADASAFGSVSAVGGDMSAYSSAVSGASSVTV